MRLETGADFNYTIDGNEIRMYPKTNSKGLTDIELNKKPFILIAKTDNQYGYLRLDDGSALSLSMFNK